MNSFLQWLMVPTTQAFAIISATAMVVAWNVYRYIDERDRLRHVKELERRIRTRVRHDQ